MTCNDFKDAIPLFLYGELSFDDEESFEAHVGKCEPCRQELAREKKFHQALMSAEANVPADLLWQCRQDLQQRLSTAALEHESWGDRLRDLFSIRFHVPSIAQPIGALALIAMGFFGGRFVPTGSLGGFMSAGVADASPITSRVRYVEPESSGRVQIVFEETRQKTLRGSLNDEGIQRLLLTAAQDSADPGLRVESMDLLKTRPEMAEVRTALLAALQHDPNAGVRLKALEGLKGSAADPDVRQALSHVLLADKNPGVRTQVIDLLIQQNERPQTVGLLQELMRKEDNGYIRMRCQKALHEMKASIGTF